MVLTAGEVLAAARLTLVEFGDFEFVEDQELYAELGAEDRRLVDEIAAQDNPAYPLGELCATAQHIDTMAGPYALPAGFWRGRRYDLEYADGIRRAVHMIHPQSGFHLPPRVPAAYIQGAAFYPVDGLYADRDADPAKRRWGWGEAKKIHFFYLAEPEVPSKGESELASPVDALKYLSRFVAALLAIRAKPEDIIVRLLHERTGSAKEQLLAFTASYGIGKT